MQPNIVLIMADQLTPILTGAYGHPVAKTPNLNRLVREGVRFDAAYSSCPLCAPARASLMTGRQTSDIKAYDNAALLPADEPTLAHYLTNAGYECVLSGKMQFTQLARSYFIRYLGQFFLSIQTSASMINRLSHQPQSSG